MLNALLYFIPFLLSLGIHEWAHAYTANKLGDNTAAFLGRLTINPIKHMDIFGTIIFPIMGLLFAIPFFGWAKPVPVNPRNFKNPHRDMAIVAAAGPISNLILAVIFAFLRSLLYPYATPYNPVLTPLYVVCEPAIWINVILAFFNLIPLPPLDGSRILRFLLPYRAGLTFERLEPYAPILLLGIFFSGIIRILLIPAMATHHFLLSLFM